jgi:hypothetical protein
MTVKTELTCQKYKIVKKMGTINFNATQLVIKINI